MYPLHFRNNGRLKLSKLKTRQSNVLRIRVSCDDMYIYRVLTPTTLATMQCDAQWTRRMQVVRMASIVSPGGERTRALREQAHFPVYPLTLFHSPPDDISKMINTTTTERTVYHGLQRDTSCASSVAQNPIRIREHLSCCALASKTWKLCEKNSRLLVIFNDNAIYQFVLKSKINWLRYSKYSCIGLNASQLMRDNGNAP